MRVFPLHMHPVAIATGFWLITLSLAPAHAAEPLTWTYRADPQNPADIVGGAEVDTCVFPSAVALRSAKSLCTGTLVHPEIVISAGHCYDAGIDYIVLGESAMGGREVAVESCKAHSSWTGSLGQGVDYSYCKLSEPVTDLPIVPPLMGCEVEVLQKGTPVYPVGYGLLDVNSQMSAGTKRWVQTEFQGFTGTKGKEEAIVGSPGKQGCMGDSGGPVYVELPEDKYGKGAGWRVFGVTSWGDMNCSDGKGYYGVMSNWVEFVESDSGIDVTPCHDADGTWNPGPDCHSVPTDPLMGSGSWPSCDPGPVGGPVTSCGDNNNGGDDDDDSSGEDSSSSGDETSTTDGETSSSDDDDDDGDGDDDDGDDDDDNDDGDDDDDTSTTETSSDDDDDNDDATDTSNESGKGDDDDDDSKDEEDDDDDDDDDASEDASGGGCAVAPLGSGWLAFAGLAVFIQRRRRGRTG